MVAKERGNGSTGKRGNGANGKKLQTVVKKRGKRENMVKMGGNGQDR